MKYITVDLEGHDLWSKWQNDQNDDNEKTNLKVLGFFSRQGQCKQKGKATRPKAFSSCFQI